MCRWMGIIVLLPGQVVAGGSATLNPNLAPLYVTAAAESKAYPLIVIPGVIRARAYPTIR